MRIDDSGSDNTGFGPGEDRSSAFRRGRRPGQKVRGRVLKRVSAEMAWVEIDGHRLLARLGPEYREGALLTFLIRQLTPEILLKAVSGPPAASGVRLATATAFETARTLCENRFRPYAAALSKRPATERADAFLSLLEGDDRLLAAYLDTLARAREISDLLPANGRRLLYQPWLIPEARRQSSLIHIPPGGGDAPMTGVLIEFELDGPGLVRAEFLNKDHETGYRLKLQRPDRRSALQTRLEVRIGEALGDVRCLGVAKLSRREHGGIVAEHLFAG